MRESTRALEKPQTTDIALLAATFVMRAEVSSGVVTPTGEITVPGDGSVTEAEDTVAPTEARHEDGHSSQDSHHEMFVWREADNYAQPADEDVPAPEAGGSGGDNTTPPGPPRRDNGEYDDFDRDEESDADWAARRAVDWAASDFLRVNPGGTLVSDADMQFDGYPGNPAWSNRPAQLEQDPDVVPPSVYEISPRTHHAAEVVETDEDIIASALESTHTPAHASTSRHLDIARQALTASARARLTPHQVLSEADLEKIETLAQKMAAVMENRPIRPASEPSGQRRVLEAQPHDVATFEQTPAGVNDEVTTELPTTPFVTEQAPYYDEQPPIQVQPQSQPLAARMRLPENPTPAQETDYWQSRIADYNTMIASGQYTAEELEGPLMMAQGELQRLASGIAPGEPDTELPDDYLTRMLRALEAGMKKELGGQE